MASTMYLVMVMPSPEPSVRRTRALSSRTKDSKILALNSGVMPMPESLMRKWMRTYSSPLSESSSYMDTWISPSSGVNFTALPKIFSST